MFAFESIESLFLNDAGFAVGFDEAVVGGGDKGAAVAIGEKVACELFAGELVEGGVLGKGLDDVFPEGAGGDGFVGDHAVGVGVADEVEPEEALVLGVFEGGGPLGDEFLVVFRGGIFLEGGDFSVSRGEAAEVVGEAA